MIKSFVAIFQELRLETLDLVRTRLQILKVEISSKLEAYKRSAILFVVAIVMAVAAWLSMTGALLSVMHVLLVPNRFAWAWAALILAGAYGTLGVVASWLGLAEIAPRRLIPKRTLMVLKHDRLWIEKERKAV
jgi:hypothetical protein